MTPDQQGLIEDIANRFVAAAPSDMQWTELQVDVSMLNSISGFAATAVDAANNETPFFIDDATDKKILHALGRLREDMARANPDRGAWYIMSLRVPRESKPYVDFDYFSKPTFGVHVGDGAYKQDLAAFPRSDDNLPEWLGGKPRPKPVEKPKSSMPAPVQTTPPVAPTPQETPPVAPPGDIQLSPEGVPLQPNAGPDQPMDEDLAAAEAVEPLPSGTNPLPPPPPQMASPEAPLPADDTPWYENPDDTPRQT